MSYPIELRVYGVLRSSFAGRSGQRTWL